MRTGKISFTTNMIRRDKDEIAEVLSQIKFLPFRVEHMFATNTLEMVGYSYKFNKIDDWDEPPYYSLQIERLEDGNIIVTDVIEEEK